MTLSSLGRNHAPWMFVPRPMKVKPRAPILNQPVALLVEDEPLVRLTQVDILREAGFWVLEAEDADEAFETMRRRQDVSVVLTDVDMPGSIDGFEFARLVAQGWPEVGVMVISGKALPDEGDLPPSAVFVPKPVYPDVLVERLNSLLTRTGSATA
jgi:two-component system, response regulator PdtaR